MINGTDEDLAIIGLFLAAWTVIAAFAIWSALRVKRLAQAERADYYRFRQLAEISPAVPIIVYSDLEILAHSRIKNWFGLTRHPQWLRELSEKGGGLTTISLHALSEAIHLSQDTGNHFHLNIEFKESVYDAARKGGVGESRLFTVAGGPASLPSVASDATLLWLFDISDESKKLRRAEEDRDDARSAFDTLSALIEAAPIPMWFNDNLNEIRLVNQAYVRAVEGQSADHVVDDQILLIDDSVSEIKDALEKTGALYKILSQKVEQLHSLHASSVRPLMVTMIGQRRALLHTQIPIEDRGTAHFVLDIDEIYASQRQLALFAHSQQELLDQISAGVAQFSPSGMLSFSNLPFLRIFSLDPDWLTGEPKLARILDRMRERDKLPPVRDFAQWRVQKQDWFRLTETHEENWVLPDGKHLRVVAHPTPDGGLLLIFEDQTEHVNLASEHDRLLRARTATFNSLFEALAVFGPDGKLSIWNQQFSDIWQLKEEFLLKHPHIDWIVEEMRKNPNLPKDLTPLRKAIKSTTDQRIERKERFDFPGGQHYQYATIPLPDGNILFTMLNISDSFRIENALRQRNSALEDASRVKNRFLSYMSYELRTPLTTISGFAELLSIGVAGPLDPTIRSYIEAIVEATANLRVRIDNLLDLSQTSAGALPLHYKEVLVFDMLKESIEAHRGQAEAKRTHIEFLGGAGLGAVRMDRKRMIQAFSLIFEDMLDHRRPGGVIRLQGVGHTDYVRIIIHDSMRHFDEAGRVQAFDPIQPHWGNDPIERNNSHAGTGTTIALPLAKELILAHEGDIVLEKAPDGGARFVITLKRE